MIYNYICDSEKKITQFKYVWATVLRTLKRKLRNNSLLTFYRIMAIAAMLYDSEVVSRL